MCNLITGAGDAKESIIIHKERNNYCVIKHPLEIKKRHRNF